jgi:nucleoside-diphosphate-sugar epimerase
MGGQAFVTGATGFIGRFLAEELKSEGWRVRALARATSNTAHLERLGAQIWVGDLKEPDSLGAGLAGVDTVYHLAALTAAHGDHEYRATNEVGTSALVDAMVAAERRPRRLVYLSSYAAGGPALGGVSRDCADEPMPLTAYGRTKLAGERQAQRAAAAGIEVLVVRAPVVYGPGDRALLPFFRLVRWRLAPAPGGEQRRLQMVYAPDLARALRRAALAPPGTYAVADPVEHRWGDIAQTIATGMERRPIEIPLPTPVIRAAASASEVWGRLTGKAAVFNREKAEEMLAPAWVCKLDGSDALLPAADVTPLREGIDSTIRWYIRQGWL